jgi:hypothetical protein
MLGNNGFIFFYHERSIRVKNFIILIYPPFGIFIKKSVHKSCIFSQKIDQNNVLEELSFLKLKNWKKMFSPSWIQLPATLNFCTWQNFCMISSSKYVKILSFIFKTTELTYETGQHRNNLLFGSIDFGQFN